MGNLTLFSGGNSGKIALRGAKSVVDALKAASRGDGSTDLPEGGVYISFSGKLGRYSIGTEKEDANPDEIWLVSVFAFEKGWICWKGGSPVAKRLGSIYQDDMPMPDFSEHGPFNTGAGEGWQQAKAMTLRSLDRGIQGYFSTNTKSARNEFEKLEGEVGRRMDAQLPCWPVVQLHREKFTAKGQSNYKPVLNVVGWLGIEQVKHLASLASTDEVVEVIDELIEEAAENERAGVPDMTLSAENGFVASDDDVAGPDDDGIDDGIEDAEEVEEEAYEVEDAEEVEEVEEVEEEPVQPTRVRRAAAAARTPAPASAPAAPAGGGRTSGLVRRNRAKV